MTSSQRIAAVLLAVAAAAPAAYGQSGSQTGACSVDDSKPKQVKEARDALVKAGLIGKPDDRVRMVTGAVRELTTPGVEATNPTGRALVLGRALVTIAAQPGAPTVVQRGTVGFATDPQSNVDLLAAADSAFRIVEQAMPACYSETEPYRRQLYAPLVTSAVNLYNAKQLDSAAALASRALVIYPRSPIAYNILGNIAQSKEDYPRAVEQFRQMVNAIGTDTSYAEDRRTAMMTIATLTTELAEQAQGARRDTLLRTARADYEAFLKAYPNDTKAQAGLARVQGLSGDTAAVARHFSAMLASPGQYTDMQLLEGGVAAARSNQPQIAAQLFEAGIQKNPLSRDGLYNLAVVYSTLEQYDKIFPVVRKLLEVDPDNPDNYQLMAIAYQAKAKQAKDAAAKKILNDSLLKYYQLYTDLPVRVTFNLFSHDGAKHTLGGAVENRGAADANYELKFDFLDASGNVVSSQTASVTAVPSKGSKPFTVVAEKEGIVAFRYAPLPTGK